ncbi:hypothetical protein ACFL56_02015 [Candidatus Margulisiibacteriota bacterium]
MKQNTKIIFNQENLKSNQKDLKITDLEIHFNIPLFNPKTEMGITNHDTHFQKIYGKTFKQAKKINKILNHAFHNQKSKKINKLTINNIEFYLRKRKRIIWATDINNAENISRTFFNNKTYNLEISTLNEKTEMAITTYDPLFNKLVPNPQLNAKKLRTKLDKIMNSKEEITENNYVYNNVNFFLRKNVSGRLIWATLKENAEKIAEKEFNVTIKYYEIPPLDEKTEMGITTEDTYLKKYIRNIQVFCKNVNDKLQQSFTNKEDRSINSLMLNDIEYFQRKRTTKTIWAAKKKDIQKIAEKESDANFYDFEIQEIKSNEMGITGNDTYFMRIIGNTSKLGTKLQEKIEKAWKKKGDNKSDSIDYHGIQYFLRRRYIHVIWATDRNNAYFIAEKECNTMYLEFDVPELHSDEAGISQTNHYFKQIRGTPDKLVKKITSELDKAWKKKKNKNENSIMHNNIEYFYRKSFVHTIWATKIENLDLIAEKELDSAIYQFNIPTLKPDEMGISNNDSAFKGIKGITFNFYKQLHNKLEEIWQKKKNKSVNEITYNNLKYYYRKKGNRIFWATNRENAPSIATKEFNTLFFDFDILPLQPDETCISSGDPNFKKIKGNALELSRILEERLNNEWQKKENFSENKLEINDIKYFIVKSGSNIKWATKTKNLSKLAAQEFGTQHYSFELIELPPDEMSITQADPTLHKIRGKNYIHIHDLNEKLDLLWQQKKDKSKNEIICNEIAYYIRKNKTHIIWTTKKQNAPHIAIKEFNSQFFDFTIPPLKDNEIGFANSNKLFNRIHGSSHKFIKILDEELNKAWDQKINKSENILQIDNITYYICKNHDHYMWATDIKNAHKLAEKLNTRYFEFDLFENTVNEVLISRNDSKFQNIKGNSRKYAEKLSEILFEKWDKKTDKTKNELEYKNIAFCIRRKGGRLIWATDISNLPAVATLLGTTLKDPSIPQTTTHHPFSDIPLVDEIIKEIPRARSRSVQFNGDAYEIRGNAPRNWDVLTDFEKFCVMFHTQLQFDKDESNLTRPLPVKKMDKMEIYVIITPDEMEKIVKRGLYAMLQGLHQTFKSSSFHIKNKDVRKEIYTPENEEIELEQIDEYIPMYTRYLQQDELEELQTKYELIRNNIKNLDALQEFINLLIKYKNIYLTKKYESERNAIVQYEEDIIDIAVQKHDKTNIHQITELIELYCFIKHNLNKKEYRETLEHFYQEKYDNIKIKTITSLPSIPRLIRNFLILLHDLNKDLFEKIKHDSESHYINQKLTNSN